MTERAKVRCPQCGTTLVTSNPGAKRKVRCTRCKAVFALSGRTAPPESEPIETEPPRSKAPWIALGVSVAGVGILAVVLLLISGNEDPPREDPRPNPPRAQAEAKPTGSETLPTRREGPPSEPDPPPTRQEGSPTRPGPKPEMVVRPTPPPKPEPTPPGAPVIRGGDGEMVLQLEEHADISSIAFSPESDKVAVTSEHGKVVRVWNVEDGRELATYPLSKLVRTPLLVFPNKDVLLGLGMSSGKCVILRWDLRPGAPIERNGPKDWLHRRQAFSPDGRWLAYSKSSGRDVKLWDIAGEQLVREIPAHERAIESIAFSPDGKRLATGSNDGKVHVWNRDTGEKQASADVRRNDSVRSCVGRGTGGCWRFAFRASC